MQRNPFQDVVPPGGKSPGDGRSRSIRNIPVMRKPKDSFRETPPPVEESVSPEETPVSHHNNYEFEKPIRSAGREKRKFSSKFFMGVAVIVVLGFIFVMMNAFTSAKISLTPKSETISFKTSSKIIDTGSVGVSSSLPYEQIAVSLKKDKEVPAAGEENAEYKSSAKIIIYNNFSKDPQRLITRTRFQTAEGLIFRIAESVVVPGKTTTPGSIEATVYADEAGDKYNIDLSDFTIPGFKNDSERFKGFYARSLTKATGGFVGKVKKVNEADKRVAVEELQESLKVDAEKDLKSKVPADSVMLTGAVIYDFSELPQAAGASSNSSSAVITQEVKAEAIVMKKKDLSALLQKNFLTEWEGLPAEIVSFDEMTLTFENASWRPEPGLVTDVRVEGNAKFMASIDTEKIKNELVGKPKSILSEIITTSPGIVSGKSAIRPIWKSTFPESLEKINISVVSP